MPDDRAPSICARRYTNAGRVGRATSSASARRSDAILAYLHRRVENPLFQCRFRRTENVIWFWEPPPQDHDYGMRDFDAVDLDGNHLTFGIQSRPPA
jgi:hypothetical protein